MAKVNLLPPELRKAKKGVSFDIKGVPVLFLALSVIFFLLGMVLRLETMIRSKTFSRISQEYRQAENLDKRVKDVKNGYDKLNQELKLLNGYLKREVTWSEKLEQLRRIIPEEVWLTQLSVEKRIAKDSETVNLFLRGSLIPQDNNSPIGTLSNFVNKLKDDKDFFADFNNLILADSRTDKRKDFEIMVFVIEMPFKKKIN